MHTARLEFPAPTGQTATQPPRLADWLDACGNYLPEYDQHMSNHLPMALQAMYELGATPAALERFAQVYAQRLTPRRVGAPLTAAELSPTALGDPAAFTPWHATMHRELNERGRDALLRRWVPRLMPGVGGSAFHGLIRVGHALAAGHDGELVMGLATWASTYAAMLPQAKQGPVDLPQHAKPLDWPRWRDAIMALSSSPPIDGFGITNRMTQWSGVPGFAEVAPALDLRGLGTAQLARAAAALYAHTGNFTVMHMLTASLALHRVMPWAGNPKLALRWFSIALAAAMRAARLQSTDWDGAARVLADAAQGDRPEPALPAWPALARQAVASMNDHAAKMLWACWQWHDITGDAVFHCAGAKAMQVQAADVPAPTR